MYFLLGQNFVWPQTVLDVRDCCKTLARLPQSANGPKRGSFELVGVPLFAEAMLIEEYLSLTACPRLNSISLGPWVQDHGSRIISSPIAVLALAIARRGAPSGPTTRHNARQACQDVGPDDSEGPGAERALLTGPCGQEEGPEAEHGMCTNGLCGQASGAPRIQATYHVGH